MRRWALYVLVSVLVAASFAAMASTPWLKQPFRPGEDVRTMIDALDSATEDPVDWERAASVRDELKSGWEAVRARIQFVAEKDDLVRFERTVDELKATLSVQDRATAKRQIELLRSIWESIR